MSGVFVVKDSLTSNRLLPTTNFEARSFYFQSKGQAKDQVTTKHPSSSVQISQEELVGVKVGNEKSRQSW